MSDVLRYFLFIFRKLKGQLDLKCKQCQSYKSDEKYVQNFIGTGYYKPY